MHRRTSLRLTEYDYSSPGEYFVTICTHNRERIFVDIIEDGMKLSPRGEIAQSRWEEIPNYYQNVELDQYIIMPDHVHGIIILTEPGGAIHCTRHHLFDLELLTTPPFR